MMSSPPSDTLSLIQHVISSQQMSVEDQAETLLHLCKDAIFDKEEDIALLALQHFQTLSVPIKDIKHGVARLFMASLTYQMAILSKKFQEDFLKEITSFPSHVLIKNYLNHVSVSRPLSDPAIVSDISTILSIFDQVSHKESISPQSATSLFVTLPLPQLKQLYEEEKSRVWGIENSLALIDAFILDPPKYDWAVNNHLLNQSFEQEDDCALLRHVVSHCCFSNQNGSSTALHFLKKIAPLYPAKILMDVTISHPDNTIRSALLDQLAQNDDNLAKDVLNQLGKKLSQVSLRKSLPYLTSLYDKRQLLKKVHASSKTKTSQKPKKM